MSTENNKVNENDDTRTRIIGSDASESTLRMGEDNNSTVRLSEPANDQPEAPKVQPTNPKSRKLLWIIIAAVIVIGGGIAAFLLLSGDKGTDKDATKGETIEEVIGTNNTDISDFIDNAVDARLDKSSDQAIEVEAEPAVDTAAVMW